ncbi:hypothetical protein [Deinococcus hopiensis]|nr:hypothetical protein [Deinococcus hopiensis]
MAHGTKKVAGREWTVLRFRVDGLGTPIHHHLRETRQGDETLLAERPT